jgi:hypothetical protein
MPPVIEVPKAPSQKNPTVDGIKHSKRNSMTIALRPGWEPQSQRAPAYVSAHQFWWSFGWMAGENFSRATVRPDQRRRIPL